MSIASFLSGIKDSIAARSSWKAGLFLLLLGATAAWILLNTAQRMGEEARNKTVEICIDWDEVTALCRENGYPLGDFIDRCQAIGVTSASLGEETIMSLERSGRVIYFPNEDYLRLKLLDLLAPGTAVNTNSIMVQDSALTDYIAWQLKLRYNTDSTLTKAGKYRVISPAAEDPMAPSIWSENLALGFLPSKIDFIASRGLSIVYRPQNRGNPAWITQQLPANFSGFLWDGREVPGYPGSEYLTAKKIKDNGSKVIAMEFYSTFGGDKINRLSPGSVVRGHAITSLELDNNLSENAALLRWTRAARERGIRFFYFHFFANRSIEDNISYLRKTAQGLKKNGFRLGVALSPGYPRRGHNSLWVMLALSAVVLVPLISLYNGKKLDNPFAAYLATNTITIAGGLFVSALLYDVFFMQKIADMPGVKLSMVLPLALSVFIIYTPRQLKHFWSTQVYVRHLVMGGVLISLLGLLLARTGNNSSLLLGSEHAARQFLENVLSVRPRTKEFLFAQPLLFAGFYFRKQWLIWLGVIGQVSIMNTFLHAHTPVSLSLIRTFHGIWLGLLIGYGIVLAGKFIKTRMKN